jgi:hypothetical protein
VIVIAICRESRVLRLLSFLSLSSAVPPLWIQRKTGFQIHAKSLSEELAHLRDAITKAEQTTRA